MQCNIYEDGFVVGVGIWKRGWSIILCRAAKKGADRNFVAVRSGYFEHPFEIKI
jgi:hypothetical protein